MKCVKIQKWKMNFRILIDVKQFIESDIFPSL